MTQSDLSDCRFVLEADLKRIEMPVSWSQSPQMSKLSGRRVELYDWEELSNRNSEELLPMRKSDLGVKFRLFVTIPKWPIRCANFAEGKG